jgi:hypothetical protein
MHRSIYDMFSRGVDVSDFRNECIRDLVSALRKVGLDKCSFEFYTNSETKPLESKENYDVEKVSALVEEIKKEHGLACKIKDSKEMNPIEVKRAYDQCAHWAQNPKKHEYRTSCTIYDIFVGGEAGDWFGKKIPAMVAHDSSSGGIIFVLPCKAQKDQFSLERKLRGEEPISRLEATISIFDFLKGLKQDLDSHA